MARMSDLASRYGSPNRTARFTLLAVVVLVVAALLGWLVWVMVVHSRPLVHSQTVSYQVVDDHAATARFAVVRREAEVRASCLLRAYAEDHAVVGEANVPVAAGVPLRTTVEATVRTERRATSVELLGCTSEGQSRRR
jgi:hypothetical protein